MSVAINTSERPIKDSRLSVEDRTAIREYWRFFEPRGVAITAGVHRSTAALPGWRQIYDQVATEDRTVEDARMYALELDAIVSGHWEPYLADLHTRGARYALAGVSYSAWFDLLASHRDLVREHMTRFIQEDIDANLRAATSISQGMNRLLDVMIETIGVAYISSREPVVPTAVTTPQLLRSEANPRRISES